jgi:hypothetical protein
MEIGLQLDGEAWTAILGELSDALGKEGPAVKLCLIGSAACLFGGMDGRTSADLDVWRPASDFDRRELQQAAQKVGLLFDPKHSLEPRRPYIQLVDPGISQVGEFEPVFVERMGRLHLFRPPIENLIAGKLIRASPKDLGDVQFLIGHHRPDLSKIRQVVLGFPEPARERAMENLVYLDILKS